MEVRGTIPKPSTSQLVKERIDSLAVMRTRTVKLAAAVSKSAKGERLNQSERMLLLDAWAGEEIKMKPVVGGILKLADANDVDVIEYEGAAYTVNACDPNALVAIYSDTGEPVFRIRHENGKYIVFKRKREAPFFQQIKSDKTVAWSEVAYKGIEYGVDNKEKCLGMMTHSADSANVEIKEGCKPDFFQELKRILGKDKKIDNMKDFCVFMEHVEMHVYAKKPIKLFAHLRMDYGYDHQGDQA